MYTIGEMCKRFNLSRSTILYYDKLGLLKPTDRQANNYRIYGEEQVERLEKIKSYRASGVSLKDIEKILNTADNEVSKILLSRLSEIQSEIAALKKQELLVIDVLKERTAYGNDVQFAPGSWTKLLEKLGYDEASRLKWHKDFEEENTMMHREFLRSLKMSDQQIKDMLAEISKN